MDDTELLALVRAERQSAVGLDNDETLRAERERALKYYKGESSIPSLANRSKAVATVVSDAIDTLHPDIVEILTGGDDVMSFMPIGPEDEKGADQETDYVKHVVFDENPGWQIIHDGTKDALQVKLGVFKAWVEECPEEVETFEGKNAVEAQLAAQNGEVGDVEQVGEDIFNFTVTRPSYRKVKIACWPPEDFAVAQDTGRSLHDDAFTYCSARSRPRKQTLLLQGISREKLDMLSPYATEDNEGVTQARDTAGEHEITPDSVGDLAKVEIREHIIKVEEGGKSKLYSVLTGENETVFIRKEEVKRNPFSTITPYPMPHRHIGECPADRLVEKQDIQTALLRMALDSGYFSNNQRYEVDESGITPNTFADVLNNQPGGLVRVKRAGTVNPLQAGALNFDVFKALEYNATQIEQATGIVRAAQGLTPDTLHDTAKGALALLTAAQKRVKLIARNFAETGLKDLYLTVHALLREHSDRKAKVRLKGEWVDIDPTSWGARSDMKIEIGLGASGREADLMTLEQESLVLEKIVTLQGGPQGPVVNWDNIYALAKRTFEKMGNKAPENFLSDPARAEPQPPAPDPDMVKVEKDAELKQMELQGKGQLQAMELQGKGMLEEQKLRQQEEAAIREHELKIQQMQAEIQLKRDIASAELELKRELLAAELQMKRELNEQQAQIARENNQERNFIQRENNSAKIDAQVNVGGDPG